MISSHRKPPVRILCIFIGAIQQVGDLGRVREKMKKTTNDRKEGRHAVKTVISLKQIPLCTFFCN